MKPLLGLIGDIYDASLDPSHWTAVLEKCADFVGGTAAVLVSKDTAAAGGNFYHDFGIEPHYAKLYRDEYIKCDPSVAGQGAQGPATLDEPAAPGDLMPYDAFLRTRFYLEWARPQRFADFVSIVLDRSATGTAMFRVFRHDGDGPVGEEARQSMRLIAPHLRRAVLVGRMLNIKEAEAASFSDVLDGLSYGVFLVDGAGRMIYVNVAGAALLLRGDLLRLTAGKLACVDVAADQMLHDSFAALDGHDTGSGVKAASLSLPSRHAEQYIAHMLPLTPVARRRAGVDHNAAAALFVRNTALSTPSSYEIIGRTYRLTPMELRVLLAIVEVGGAPQASEALGIAVTTVKTHLGRLFEKTGIDRQADLVKLVAGFATPFVG